jgi:hypothetical protein
MKPGCERQDGRVLKLGELASKIGVEEQRKQVRDLVTKHKRILLLFKRLEQKLRRVADEVRLCEAEGREIQVRSLGFLPRMLNFIYNGFSSKLFSLKV